MNETTEQERRVMADVTGAVVYYKSIAGSRRAEDNRLAVARVLLAHGFDGLRAVIKTDPDPKGRELNAIINAGYPVDRLTAFLLALGAP